MFPSENEITYIKPAKPNMTYNKLPKSPIAKTSKKVNDKICLIPDESPMNVENSNQSSAKFDSKTKRSLFFCSFFIVLSKMLWVNFLLVNICMQFLVENL